MVSLDEIDEMRREWSKEELISQLRDEEERHQALIKYTVKLQSKVQELANELVTAASWASMHKEIEKEED